MRRCILALVVGSALAACGGASNGSFAPRLPAVGVHPVIDELYNFGLPPDAEEPSAGLLAGKNGEYYGTSMIGGSSRDGAVYEITESGKEKVLYSFQGGADGAHPRSTLIADTSGALYGVAAEGGSSSCSYGGEYTGCGTVFKLTPGKRGWTESVLYTFEGGLHDGALPLGGLLMTKSGALLGTTNAGGKNGTGTVFDLTPSGSGYSETIVHSFTGPPDGLNPADALVSDSRGNLYGTTSLGGLVKLYCHKKFGGGGGCGTIFKLTASGSTYKYSVIYGFKGGRDGSRPTASLLLGAKDVFYGLTTGGGGVKPGDGQGTVFSVTTGGSERVLYRFLGGSGHRDGTDPDDTPGLVADRSGNLYGTTAFGGGSADARPATACSGGCGTVFKLAPSGRGFTESVLYAFKGATDGSSPLGGVIIDGKGNLLGSTLRGGNDSHCACGTIFSVTP